MIRRRRQQREIAFSFDSFLDVVANVVGIILRLILVAWVGARSYKATVPVPPMPTQAEEEVVALPPESTDPLAPVLTSRQREVEAARDKLQEKARAGREVEQKVSVVEDELTAVTRRRKQLEAERAAKAKTQEEPDPAKRAAAATFAEMKSRIARLQNDLNEMAKLPAAKQTLRYRTPVSRPLQTDELTFECRDGRVTLVDVGRLLEDARQRIQDKSDVLRRQWKFEDDTEPVGEFRLHFVVERERNALDEYGAAGTPDERSNYRYGMTAWQAVPLDPRRGESVEQALAPGSAFRKVIDSIDPDQTAVTFWVYPDSFAAFRGLRDALYDRDIVVAGRPIPDGYPIAASLRHGTASRGQ